MFAVYDHEVESFVSCIYDYGIEFGDDNKIEFATVELAEAFLIFIEAFLGEDLDYNFSVMEV